MKEKRVSLSKRATHSNPCFGLGLITLLTSYEIQSARPFFKTKTHRQGLNLWGQTHCQRTLLVVVELVQTADILSLSKVHISLVNVSSKDDENISSSWLFILYWLFWSKILFNRLTLKMQDINNTSQMLDVASRLVYVDSLLSINKVIVIKISSRELLLNKLLEKVRWLQWRWRNQYFL